MSAKEIQENVNSLDFSKIPQKVDTDEHKKTGSWVISEQINHLIGGDLATMHRLFTKFGWYSSSYFYNWLQETIAKYSTSSRKGRSTFADFRDQGFHDLHVVATNVSTQTSDVFSASRTPDVAVADAVRMSMSVPLFFESMQFDGHQFGTGDHYSDGGVMRNYAINIFDQPGFEKDNPWYIDATNWETLGCYTYSSEVAKHTAPCKSLVEFIENVLKAFLMAQNIAFQTSEAAQLRTILINNCGISPLDFNIKPGDEDYNKLYESGKKAATEYLDNYQPPLRG